MGSLDVTEAKEQFLLLVDKVNGVHLPTFAIWLDTKLAEYKVQGVIKDDDKAECEQQYPEWISRSLRQNLSFIFPDKSNHLLRSSSPVWESPKSGVKRKRDTQSEMPISPKSLRLFNGDIADSLTITREVGSAEAKEVQEIVIQLEDSSDEEDNHQKVGSSNALLNSSVCRSEINVSPVPLVDQTFSLQSLGPSALNSPTNVSNLNDLMNKYSTEGYRVMANQQAPVFVPATMVQYPVSEPSAITQHTVPTQSSPGPAVSVALPRGSVPQGTSGPHLEVNSGSHIDESSPHWRKDHHGYACVLCSWTCIIKNDMRRHVRKHTGERPFACLHCNNSFRQKGHLTSHMRKHTGETPYKCAYCNASFTEARNRLKHHLRLHENELLPQSSMQKS